MKDNQVDQSVQEEIQCKDGRAAKLQEGGTSRRKFLGKMGTATLAAGVLGNASKAIAQTDDVSAADQDNDEDVFFDSRRRVQTARTLRATLARRDSEIPIPSHLTNGELERYSDHSASFSKCLLQDGICVVNPAAWASFVKALKSGKNSDFEAIILGGTRTLNGPQGAYAYDLESADSSQFGNAPPNGEPTGRPLVPPFDHVTSEAYGTQLVELYWASLLRDVAFTDFATNPTAAAAAAELSAMPTYRGPRDQNGNVTAELLFRGIYQGETIGPYISQFMITPTYMGQEPMPQLMNTYVPNVDYMTDPKTFLQVQNGISTGLSDENDPLHQYLHNFRGLAAFTHVDVLYQAYFVGLLVILTLAVPGNPGGPYVNSRTQNGFCTWGLPDFAATVGELAARALDHVWLQKWLVHLTHRPEWGGGLVQQVLSGNGNQVQAHPNSNVLNSKAVEQSFRKHGTWFLSQAFPEGSPAHPSYPTGHGTVGGACITILKVFFDGNYVIPNPMVPSSDGLSLQPYTGPDAGEITINGELNKLARNVTFGHGVGAGIHWRTDSDTSMRLGEAVALSFLQDKAQTYNEKFTVNITRLDGSIATISNE
jgi:hypothetical protein